MRTLVAPLVLTAAGLAMPAAAHPHIFVQSEVEIVADAEGRVQGVRLTWVYDEFFSYMLTADLGLDLDGDLVLSQAEAETLAASVLDWPPDFEGDLYVMQGGEPVALGPRADAAVTYEGGRVRESHFRPLAYAATASASTPVFVQVYDRYYYVAYEIVGQVPVTGNPACAASVTKADLAAAYSLVDELLYGRPASDVGVEEQFPEVGQAFSDTVSVTCSA